MITQHTVLLDLELRSVLPSCSKILCRATLKVLLPLSCGFEEPLVQEGLQEKELTKAWHCFWGNGCCHHSPKIALRVHLLYAMKTGAPSTIANGGPDEDIF